jgi:high-affinity iron transporter
MTTTYWNSFTRLIAIGLLVTCCFTSSVYALSNLDEAGAKWDAWVESVDQAVIDAYGVDADVKLPAPPDMSQAWESQAARDVLASSASIESNNVARSAGVLRARAQQALIFEMADAVRASDVPRAQAWRARLVKPRGASSAQGALTLQVLTANTDQRETAVRELTREAITWQTTRARQLLDEAARSTHRDIPMPGRLAERFAEAMTLADLPASLRSLAGIGDQPPIGTGPAEKFAGMLVQPWTQLASTADMLRRDIESTLPSLLTPEERARREKLLLKLVILVPREYSAGIRNGEVTVPLEYRESIAFTAQARQFTGELAPLWLAGQSGDAQRNAVATLEAKLAEADALIARKASPDEVTAALTAAREELEGPLQISLRRSGSTAAIVEVVLLETRSLLNASLAAALSGKWDEAEQLRLEAYTTFDPDLEARLMPRDPQLAIDIEMLLLDGIDQPGIKALLDRRAGGTELEAAYTRVNDAMSKAGALLKSGVSPTAAAINSASIVLREGLEGLLVIVAILAGLRGAENRNRRRLVWSGVVAAGVATAVTYILSQTILARLQAYTEIIEAITALLAIGVLLLITNWLFHQIYWNQWVSTLKAQCEGESAWQLISVGFLIGYREGFETIVFLQSLVLDAGGMPVGLGVTVGMAILIGCGFAALGMGLRLPYFKMLMVTAMLIGIVLITFVGNGVRTMQTVGWLPVHRIAPTSFPAWVGQWLGIYNTWESVISQVFIASVVIGTWRISRWRAKRAAAKRRVVRESNDHVSRHQPVAA